MLLLRDYCIYFKQKIFQNIIINKRIINKDIKDNNEVGGKLGYELGNKTFVNFAILDKLILIKISINGKNSKM